MRKRRRLRHMEIGFDLRCVQSYCRGDSAHGVGLLDGRPGRQGNRNKKSVFLAEDILKDFVIPTGLKTFSAKTTF